MDYLRKSGVSYAHLGGVIDGCAWVGKRVALIDFKHSEKSPLTEGQGKLLAADCPICFVWDEMSARAVVEHLKAGE